MVGNVVSRRYAKALVEIANRDGRLDDTGNELREVNDLFKKERVLLRFMTNPAVRITAKKDALNAIIQSVEVSELTARFLNLLLEKDRLRYLETIIFFYEELAHQIKNRIRAKVVSASPLADEQRDEIMRRLSAITGKQVELTMEINPDLIGGLMVQVGSTIYDGSLKNQLFRLKQELLSV